jgi:fibronectin-binding autotransporter adhesin
MLALTPDQIVFSGATRSNLTVNSGTELEVCSGGLTVSTTVFSGGLESPIAGGLVENVTVMAGGFLVGSGQLGGTSDIYGTVNGVTVVKSGLEGQPYSMIVMSGGKAVNVTLAGGAFDMVSAGGAASGGLIKDESVAFDYGMMSGAKVSSGDIFVQAGGTAHGDVIENGGYEVVDWSGDASAGMVGGVASHETILSGGLLRISSAGVALATVVASGGIETVAVGANANGTVLYAGYEYDYGHASGTIVRFKGQEIVEADGVTTGSVISAGGWEIVQGGGAANGATVSAGGELLLSSGAEFYGTLSIAGGTAAISGAMGWGQGVNFGSSGVLQLEDLADFHATISGMTGAAQQIDLAGFAYSNSERLYWAQTGTSGTLSLIDGAQTAQLTLVGTFAKSDFHLATDGKGGTVVTDAPSASAAAVTGREAVGFVQAMAVFGGGAAMPAYAADRPHEAGLMGFPTLMPSPSSGR